MVGEFSTKTVYFLAASALILAAPARATDKSDPSVTIIRRSASSKTVTARAVVDSTRSHRVTAKPRLQTPHASPTVYTTETDTKFHAKGCPRLRGIAQEHQMDQAMQAGFGPCPRCSKYLVRPYYSSAGQRGRRRGRVRSGNLRSGGPPYITLIKPKHRTVESFPNLFLRYNVR